jgi:diguanylate cyclase (GGDEF)-like protein
MQKPGTPINEGIRIEALRSSGLLDSPAEERFDRITRMASKMFNVPISLVSLVDTNRQWFKSCIGLPVLETPRDISFCGHAILGENVFVIPDTAEDERFADNPLVVNDPLIRFYAGCPLTLNNGLKLGTLCIIDRNPRSFDQDDQDLLTDLATMVINEISALQLATMDDLTDISNRRGFEQLAEHSLKMCKRENKVASVVFFDLNGFKPINDTYGHEKGDEALKNFSNLLRESVRSSDLVGRLGGDEFAVLLVGSDKEQAEIVIEGFDKMVTLFNYDQQDSYQLSFSYGVTEFNPEDNLEIGELLNNADELMYECKQALKVNR